MAQLNGNKQLISQSVIGNVSGYNVYLRQYAWESDLNSQTNKSIISVNLTIYYDAESYYSFYTYDGISSSVEGLVSMSEYLGGYITITGGQELLILAKTYEVTHNANGTLSGTMKGNATIHNWFSGSTETNVNCMTIPRYVNITSFVVSKRDETSVKYSYSVDAPCDWAWYSINNGASWHNLPNTGIISGLSPNTTYNFKLRMRRTDSQLTTDSGTYQQTTYNYPHITSAPSFTIGSKLKINLYNPLGRNCELHIIGNNNSQLDIVSTTTTSISGFLNDAWKTAWYNSIPNSKSGTYKVRLVVSDLGRDTTITGGTYSIIGNEVPTFSNFEYEDTDNKSLSLTQNNQILVSGESNCLFKVSPTNKAYSNYGASITKYIVNWGSGQNEMAFSNDEEVSAYVYNNNGNVLKVTAIDSRGLSTVVSKEISLVSYIKSVINSIDIQRNNGIEEQTFIGGEFTIWKGNWNNSDNADYDNKLKYVAYQVYIDNAWSEEYDITEEVNNVATITDYSNYKKIKFYIDDAIEIHENGSSGGFEIGTQYKIRLIIKDGNNIATYNPDNIVTFEAIVTDGKIGMSRYKDSNGNYHYGINCMPDENFALKVEGNVSVDNYSAEETIIGTWVDGKPIYRKVFFGSSTASPTVILQADNIDTYIKGYGSIKYAENLDIPINTAFGAETGPSDANNLRLIKQGVNTFVLQCGSGMLGKNFIAIVEYTKTTDIAKFDITNLMNLMCYEE